MLYQLHTWQQAALTPFRWAAEATNRGLMRNPLHPLSYTPAGRAIGAALEVFDDIARPYGKPAFGFESTIIAGKSYPIAEKIVSRRTFCQLKHFERIGANRHDPKLLIVAPLSGHYATLLRGTVEALLPDHDVYLTAWRDARAVPLRDGPFDLDDYIDYLIAFLHELGPGTHMMAVCQPSVPVLAAASLMAAANDACAPASMTLMGGPIDTRINPTAPNKLAMEHPIDWFERTVVDRVPIIYPGFMRRVYPGFLQLTGFMTMNLERHVNAHIELFHQLVRGDGESARTQQNFYTEYRSVMDLPAEYYLQTVKTVFQEHSLPRGAMICRDHKVEPSAITRTALLTIEGEMDDISGVGQTRAAHDLLTSLPAAMHAHYEQKGVGHYGVFNGRRWRENIAPKVRDFIRTHRRDEK